MAVLIFVVLIVVAVGVVLVLKARQSPPGDVELAFENRGILFTPAERSFLGVLKQSLTKSHNRVFGKDRLGDIGKPAKGLSASKRTTAQNRINQKHADFVICTESDLSLVAVVELDDQSHSRDDRAGRDGFVDAALSSAKVPVIRFPAKKSYALAEVAAKLQSVLTDLHGAASNRDNAEEASPPPAATQAETVRSDAVSIESTPVCEKCSAEMVKRQAKNGPHAGKFFWACSTYPKCRNVVAIPP